MTVDIGMARFIVGKSCSINQYEGMKAPSCVGRILDLNG